jgi:hypothetical protein
MQKDIDPKSIVKLHLVNRSTWKHANGTVIQEGDYNGYRAATPSGDKRVFMALQPGDLSVDWLDVTDQAKAGQFMIFERDDFANRLARKLGLQQTPGKDVMRKWAARIRELVAGNTFDQAAMKAAAEIFPAEFQATRYDGQRDSIEKLVADIEESTK